VAVGARYARSRSTAGRAVSSSAIASPLVFRVWFVGVGGYSVGEGDEVVLGQPLAGSRVDVPILGDVSRSHATIRRSGEGYLLIPRKTTKLEGREIVDAAILADGGFQQGGQNIHYLEKRLAERKEKSLSIV